MKKTWSIDTDAPLQLVLDSPECPSLLRQALTGVLSWQTRNRTPVGRALRSSQIAPQWVAALLALGATVTVEGKEMPLETVLQQKVEDEVSTLHIPLPLFPSHEEGRKEGRWWGEAHVARTPADDPIVAAVAVVEMDGSVVQQARVALTGVWPEAVRLAEAPSRLVGSPLDKSSIWEAAAAVEEEVAPTGDFRGSAEYRRAMAGVLTRRALEACLRQEVKNE
jgi:carbon-monoxide dehydrogenase medium subunit